MTRLQAADVLGMHWRSWQNWELGVGAPMRPLDYRVFLHLTGLKEIPFGAYTTQGNVRPLDSGDPVSGKVAAYFERVDASRETSS